MKKLSLILIISVAVLVLSNCSNRENKIVGIWKLDTMEINGTELPGTSLGDWLWEFNDEGGYLVNVAGAVEKGKYKLTDHKLVLESVTSKGRPAQEYNIDKLDSINLSVSAIGKDNLSHLSFVKISKGEAGEKD